MIQLVPHLRVLVAREAVDFRKGMDALAGVVRAQFGDDPFSGALFVFRGRGARPHSSAGRPCHHW